MRVFVHESERRSERLISTTRLEHACVLLAAQRVGIPSGLQHALMLLLSDGSVSGSVVVVCDVSVLSLSANASWKCCVRWYAYADGHDAPEWQCEAVVRRLGRCRWQQAMWVLRAATL